MHFQGTRRYVVRRELGVGAAGRVFEAWDAERKCEVALKTLVSLSPRSVYRFKSEFRALADIRHENLAALHELVAEGDTWFIVMELVRGSTWTHWVRGPEAPLPSDSTTFLSQDGLPVALEEVGAVVEAGPAGPPPDPDRVRDAIVQLLRGLDALHSHGKLHRDVKPGNVVVTPEGRVVLLDFGLVYDVDRAVSELSRVDRVVGTAAYMAPEQALGEAPSPAGDLYSVGVMLFQALTGRLPFEGGMVEMLSAKQVRDAPPPGALVHGLPPDLEDLATDLLQRAPDARPTAREALRRLGAPDVGPLRAATTLVGRDAERQELEDAWTRARNGRATLLAVTGPPGIGKTALVRQFLGGLKRFEDPWILRGRCHEREAVPFKAVDALMDSLRRQLARLPVEAVAAVDPGGLGPLVQLFPVLAEVFDPEDTDFDELEGEELRRAAVQSGAALLRALARERPVVLFLDDVQWGDVGSARMLLRWAAELGRSRLLVVLTGRPDGPLLAAMAQDKRWVRIEARGVELGALGDEAVRTMARALLDGAGDAAHDAVDWVVRESRGHPALAMELASAWLEEPFELGSVGFDDLLRRKVDRLPRETQRVLFAAAVCGRPVPTGVLARALGVDDVEPAVARLVDDRLLRSARLGPIALVELLHARLGRGILERELPEARARMHLAVADALRERGWGEPETLVEHYLAAGEQGRVGPLAMAAAEQALASLAYDKAVALYRTALAFVGEPDRSIAQRALAEALALAGRGLEAADAFHDLARSSEGLVRIAWLRRAAEQALYTGHVDRGLGWFDEVLGALGLPAVADEPSAVRTTAARLWSNVASVFGERRKAGPDPLIAERIDACFAVAISLQLLDPRRAAYYHFRALTDARRIGDPFRLARSRCLGLAMRAATSSDWEAWRKELGVLRDDVAKLHSPYALGLLATCEGLSAYLDGTYRAGLRVLSGAERHLAHVSAPFELTVARVFRVRCLVYAGQLESAERMRDSYLADGQDRGNDLLVRCLHGDVMALVDLARDRPDEVQSHVLDILESWSGGRWPFQRLFAYRAEAMRLLYVGRPQAAWDVTDRLLELVPRLGGNAVSEMHVDALRARVAVACAAAGDTGRLDEAEARARRLDKRAHRLGGPYAHLARGAASAVRSEGADAVGHLEAAALAFDRADLGLATTAARRAVAILKGDERALAAADGWLRHQGVVHPERICRVFVPGLD
ncbi:MAG: AAA family ATPase [Alphaproteobacteria bacterium]|nr:AAA family ATPase [Alphaproteobacteria bacterium]